MMFHQKKRESAQISAGFPLKCDLDICQHDSKTKRCRFVPGSKTAPPRSAAEWICPKIAYVQYPIFHALVHHDLCLLFQGHAMKVYASSQPEAHLNLPGYSHLYPSWLQLHILGQMFHNISNIYPWCTVDFSNDSQYSSFVSDVVQCCKLRCQWYINQGIF